MRLLLAALPALALASCSAGEDAASESAETTSYEAVQGVSDDAGRAPGIAVTAAPGVAFAYSYAFRLPPVAIAATQEAHAQACEKLGAAHCRITGMRYRLLGENNVEAMLAFKLDPAIARLFGKQGIDAVAAAKGKLVDAEITGTNVSAAIGRLTTQRAQADDELRRIDALLARPGTPAAERASLQAQRAEILRRVQAIGATADDQRESLATTPMAFEYGSGPVVRGFDASAPLVSARDTVAASAQVTLAVVLGALALLGPPALALAGLWLLWRRFGRRFGTAGRPA